MDNYEDLIKALRHCLVQNRCDGCPFYASDKQTEHCANMNTLAADAIEELSAKATPKRVGFDGWKGCRNTRYKCPYCKKNVRNDETYCHKCGQALMFPRISHTPYVPGEKQDVIVTWPDEPPKEES